MDFVDLFCEAGYFRTSDLLRLAEAADQRGIRLKAHTNPFQSIGGVSASIQAKALSIDHLEVFSDEDRSALGAAWSQGIGPMPVALPHC